MSDAAQEIVTLDKARAHGLKRYFTGLKCKRGHVVERMTSNRRCLLCLTDHTKNWKKANPAKVAAAKKSWDERNVEHIAAYNKANVDKLLARARKWRKNNPEKFKNAVQAWRRDNKEEIAEKARLYRIQNRDALTIKKRIYSRANPHIRRNSEAKRRAAKAQAPGFFMQSDILDLEKKQNCLCSLCRASIKDGYHVDHIVPLADTESTSNWPSNLQLLCQPCNNKKWKHPKEIWEKRLLRG